MIQWIRLRTDSDDTGTPAADVHVARRPKPDRPTAIEIYPSTTHAPDDVFPCEAHVLREGPGDLTFIGILHRLDGMTRSDFGDYWLNQHSHLGLQLPRLQRYIQRHAVEDAPIDGIVELGFESEADLREALGSPIMQEDLRRDEERFLDQSRSWGYIAHRERPGEGETGP